MLGASAMPLNLKGPKNNVTEVVRALPLLPSTLESPSHLDRHAPTVNTPSKQNVGRDSFTSITPPSMLFALCSLLYLPPARRLLRSLTVICHIDIDIEISCGAKLSWLSAKLAKMQ